MKFAVFTVSTPDYEPLPLMEVLSKLEYDGVEWRTIEDKGDRSKPSFWSGNRASLSCADLLARANELKRKAEALNLEMPSLAAYIDTSNLAVVEDHCRAAAAVGAKNLRIGPGAYKPDNGPFRTQFAAARARYAEVAKIAARHHVRAVVETHMGLLTPSACLARSLLEGLDPKHVGIMWDPGNQVVEGGEVYAMAISIAGEYLAEVHAKNTSHMLKEVKNGHQIWATTSVPLREGVVDWPDVISELRRAGYDGWIVFEDFSTTYPLLERLQGNLAWFRELANAEL